MFLCLRYSWKYDLPFNGLPIYSIDHILYCTGDFVIPFANQCSMEIVYKKAIPVLLNSSVLTTLTSNSFGVLYPMITYIVHLNFNFVLCEKQGLVLFPSC